jgi:hypothetical protein
MKRSILNQSRFLRDKLHEGLEHFARIHDPFAADPVTPMSRRLQPDPMPTVDPESVLQATGHWLNQFYDVYYRTLSRLVLVAEELERRHAIEPLPEPGDLEFPTPEPRRLHGNPTDG